MSLIKLNKMNFRFLLAIIIIIFPGCSNDMEVKDNQVPSVNIIYDIEALKVTLTGSAVDIDGVISEVKINWGDNNSDILINNDFTNIEESHIYSDPSSYNIVVTVIDNKGDSAIQFIPVVVDFNETSLDNIKENLFKTLDNEYLILTINLHTYQETQQNEKFNLLTDVIGKMDVDFIAFQECAQYKYSTITEGIIREDNMALIIANRLQEKYNIEYSFVWHWAHYGWTVWEEGVAILSKYPVIDSEDRYISSGTSVNNITSRKVIYGSYQVPDGRINIFSAHTHWRTSETDEEQNNQIKNIKSMVDEKQSENPDAVSFICGDFNSNPTSDYPWSEGYNTMMENNLYVDSFFEIYPDANNKPAQSIYNTIGGDFPGRIDYIFMKSNDNFKVEDSQIIFKTDVVGKISDHYGVLTKITYNR